MRTYTAEQIARGITFAWAYHRKLRRFLRKSYPAGAFGRGGPSPDDPNFVHHVLSAELADELGVPYDDYVEAHFWVEQRLRGRHPQVRFLHRRAGFGAAERVAAWRQAQAKAPEGAVLAAGAIEPIRRPERFAVQERYLRDLCARWAATPEEILAALGGPDAGVFDPAWLRTQPAWTALRASGHFARNPGPDIAALRACQARAREGGLR